METAHYQAVSALEMKDEFVATGGQDSRLKIWLFSSLCFQKDPKFEFEFRDHADQITSLCFSPNTSKRLFSASLDKTVKLYDLPSKLCLKTITLQSSVSKILLNNLEALLFVILDNQNIYQLALEHEDENKKKTLVHKKKVTDMTLTLDNSYLVSGDANGLVYIWNLNQVDQQTQIPSVKLFELHKGQGAITNLVAIKRPVSLFGLKANLKSYAPGEVQQFQK